MEELTLIVKMATHVERSATGHRWIVESIDGSTYSVFIPANQKENRLRGIKPNDKIVIKSYSKIVGTASGVEWYFQTINSTLL